MNTDPHTDLEAAYGMQEESLINYDTNIKDEYSRTDNLTLNTLVHNSVDEIKKKVDKMINESTNKSKTDLAINWLQDPLANCPTPKIDNMNVGTDYHPVSIDVKTERLDDEDYLEGNSTIFNPDFLNNGMEGGHSIFGEDYSPDLNLLSRTVKNKETNSSTERQLLAAQSQNQMTGERCQENVRLRGEKATIINVTTCERCNFKTTDPRHIDCLIVTQPGAKPYSCDVCQKAFKFKNKLVTHVRIHIGDKPFKCDVCQKAFRLKNKLKVHSRVHTNIRPYVCHVCDKAFYESRSLKYHLSTHTDDKPFPCDICDKSFAYSSGLQRHMKIHTGDRPFSCNVCQKTFKQKCNLERHLRVHSGEKPYPCHICKKNFIESGHLQIHLRIHSGEKPFVCDVCDKRFTIKNGLQRHMRIHTGDRPYACKICKRTFNEKSNFLKHERICNKKPFHRKLLNLIPEIIYLTQAKKKS